MAKRKGSPLLPNWPDVSTLDDLKSIRDHWASCITEYEDRVQQGQTRWARHLPIVRERHTLWVDLVARRERGEKISKRFYDFVRVQ